MCHVRHLVDNRVDLPSFTVNFRGVYERVHPYHSSRIKESFSKIIYISKVTVGIIENALEYLCNVFSFCTRYKDRVIENERLLRRKCNQRKFKRQQVLSQF